MRVCLRCPTLLAFMGAMSDPAAKSGLALAAGDGPHIRASLVAEDATPAPGETVTLAFAMRPEPGWHGYWENPGDAGKGLELGWSLPTGAAAGALRYPVPETLIVAGLMNHVYEGPYAVLVDLTLPKGLTPGTSLPVRP